MTDICPQGACNAEPSEPIGAVPDLARDLVAQRIKQAIKSQLFDRDAGVAPRIGHFVVLREVGRGGMGVVYAAYDEVLDRRVAIKVLYGTAAGDGAAASCLVAEAQAMARLNHPNIAAVYEVGTHEGRVFIAMEFVQGTPLDTWLTGRPRPWREVVDVFVQAARGLHAAHAAGLVHRDFKPANAMLGEDGRVRVLDFGLARASRSLAPHTDLEPVTLRESATFSSARTERLQPARARSGTAIVGTPAYMPPEQFRGETTDARADQYALCVSLYEGLYGQLPFHGRTLADLQAAVLQGPPRSPPRGKSVPSRLHPILLRGMSRDPAHRHGSVAELAAALERRPRRRLLLALAALFGLTAVSAVILGGDALRGRCEFADAFLAGVWDDTRRGELRAVFDASSSPLVPDAWSTAEHALDARANALTRELRDGCEANRDGGESDLLYERRRGCLDRARLGLEVSVDALGRLSPIHVGTVEAALQAMWTPGDCANDTALLAGEDPIAVEHRPAIEADLREFFSLEARRFTIEKRIGSDPHNFEELIGASAVLVERARALGYPRHLARILRQSAEIRAIAGQEREGCELLMEGFALAEAGGDDETAALVAHKIPSICASARAGKRQWLHVVRGKVNRGGLAGTPVHVSMLGELAAAFRMDGDRTAHRQLVMEALELVAQRPEAYKASDSAFQSVMDLFALGSALAEPTLQNRLTTVLEGVVGHGVHSFVWEISVRIEAQTKAGNWIAAERLMEASLVTLTASYPEAWREAVWLRPMLAELQLTQDRCLAARATLETAKQTVDEMTATIVALSDISIQRLCGDPLLSHASLALVESTIPDPYVKRLVRVLAATEFDRSHADEIEGLIVDCPNTALCSDNLSLMPSLLEMQADILLTLGEPEQALAAARRSIARSTWLWGAENIVTVAARTTLGRALLELGEVDNAIAELEHASALRRNADPTFRGDTTFALWAAYVRKGDLERATAAATRARDDYSTDPRRRASALAQLETWLAVGPG